MPYWLNLFADIGISSIFGAGINSEKLGRFFSTWKYVDCKHILIFMGMFIISLWCFHGAGVIQGQWVKLMRCIENIKIVLHACQKTCLSCKNIRHVDQNSCRQRLCWKFVFGGKKYGHINFPFLHRWLFFLWCSVNYHAIVIIFATGFFGLHCYPHPLCIIYRERRGRLEEGTSLFCNVRRYGQG